MCRRKFLRVFPKGFKDSKYIAWERGYKWDAHLRWEELLNKKVLTQLITAGEFEEVARRATQVESRTNLLFSFEKMALRDGVRSPEGARSFALGLQAWIHGKRRTEERFGRFTEMLDALPRRQTRVLTWPSQTVFGFIALPQEHIFLKPQVTKAAALAYRFPFAYRSRPNWNTYSNVLEFAELVREDLADLGPRDMIDIRSFLWVLGSSEYA